jgi:hypothetical protein
VRIARCNDGGNATVLDKNGAGTDQAFAVNVDNGNVCDGDVLPVK